MTVMSTKHTIQGQQCAMIHTQHIPDMLPIQQQVIKFAVSTCVVVEFKKSTEAVNTGIKMSSEC